VLGAKQYVIAPIAERREANQNHCQTEIEIFSEPLPAGIPFQVPIRRRENSHVDLPVPDPADPAHDPLFDGAQQLALKSQLHVANFIEEKESTLGRLEQADLRLFGIGESAALVAEELGFQQGGGGAIDVDKGRSPGFEAESSWPLALAGSGFPQDRASRQGRDLPNLSGSTRA
jgi:hypothetical protein